MRPQDKINQKLPMGHRWDKLPCNRDGDAHFTTLDQVHKLFSHEEIVVLVNRALYTMKYQREHHQKRYQATKERRGITNGE